MILVTGGTGFIGSHLLYNLIQAGEKVRVLTRNKKNNQFTKKIFRYYSNDDDGGFSKLEWIEGDILDIFSLQEAMQNVDHVYHCAALVSFHPSDKKSLNKINIEGTANVINTALDSKVQKLCYISSIAALGREDNIFVIDEKTTWKKSRKNSMYAISKYGAEREVWRGSVEGLNTIIVNPSVVLGPSENYKANSEIFYTVWNGLRFYTKGINGFVDVRDVAKVMIALMNSEIVNERFILSSENFSYQNVFDEIAKFLGKKQPNIYVNPFFGEFAWRLEKTRSFITNKKPFITKETARTACQTNRYSNEKICKTLNYNFISIQQSIHDMCHYFIKEMDN
ncbi:NAD-dependent epimerase/dehydratase family protein [Bacteroidota bacterium]